VDGGSDKGEETFKNALWKDLSCLKRNASQDRSNFMYNFKGFFDSSFHFEAGTLHTAFPTFLLLKVFPNLSNKKTKKIIKTLNVKKVSVKEVIDVFIV
jgi:hypothetical protein